MGTGDLIVMGNAPAFVNIRTGLLEPKHIKAMGGGSPLALYLWLQTRVRFTGDGAGCTPPNEPYRHEDAADALGASFGSVRRWFRALLAGGYITASTTRYGMHVVITKYRPGESRVSKSEHPPINRVSTDAHPEPPRVSRNEQARPPQGAQIWTADCPDLDGRLSRNEHPVIRTRAATDSSETTEGDPPLTPLTAAPKANKLAEFIDAIREQGSGEVPYEPSAVDGRALKDTKLTGTQVAEVYVAIALGRFGDSWLRDRLSVQTAVKSWNGYAVAKRSPPKTARGAPVRVSADDERLKAFDKYG